MVESGRSGAGTSVRWRGSVAAVFVVALAVMVVLGEWAATAILAPVTAVEVYLAVRAFRSRPGSGRLRRRPPPKV